MKYNLLNELKDVEVNEEQLNEIKDLLGLETEWKPKYHEQYWTIEYYYGYWRINPQVWINSTADKRMLENDVAFQFEEEAQQEADKRNFLEQMKLDFKSNSDEIAWEDENQTKYYVYYTRKSKKIHFDSWYSLDYGPLRTTNHEWLQQYIKDNEEDIKKYYFGIDD